MTGTECQLCGRPSGDDAYVCTGCAGAAADALRQVAGERGLAYDLDIAIARLGTRPTTHGGGRTKASEAPMPIDVRASDAREHLKGVLVGWVRVAAEDGVRAALPADDLAAIAAWLVPLCGWARHAPYGAELVDEVLDAVADARRAVDTPPDRIGVGRCPNCHAPVYAPAGAAWGWCRTDDCDGAVSVEAWQGYLRDLAWGHEAGASELAAFCRTHLGVKITPGTIRSWASRGHLHRTNPGDGVPRYRFADVARLAAEGPRAGRKKEMMAS
ncbi:MAG TPA: hypothetical protein VKZ82_28390 [Nonomuraea sp.]|nr:hypothetical protein [Nonomuraea sp.]